MEEFKEIDNSLKDFDKCLRHNQKDSNVSTPSIRDRHP